MRQPDYRPRSERLTRDVDHKILGGVCAGIARHYGYDVMLVRVVTVLLTLVWGAGLLVYAVLWMVMPVEQAGSSLVSSLGDASEDASQSTSSITGGSGPGFVNDDLADRARRAAEELTVAARTAAESARIAAEQLSEVAKAAATAGRAAWDQQQQHRAASARSESSDASSNGSSTPPPPPMTPPPSSQTTPPPHEDVHRD